MFFITDDQIAERLHETIDIALTAVSDPIQIDTVHGDATLSIVDDDDCTITIVGKTVQEDIGVMTLDLVASHAVDTDVQIAYRTVNGDCPGGDPPCVGQAWGTETGNSQNRGPFVVSPDFKSVLEDDG